MSRRDHHNRAIAAVLTVATLTAAWTAQGQNRSVAGAGFVERPATAIVAWGDGVTVWHLGDGQPERHFQGRRFAAGCADRDGTVYLLQGRRLITASPPYATTSQLESETAFQDCLPWTMNGRRGVLIPHRHLQLRFYSLGTPPVDLYSIYTPSKQGGLLEADVDADGRPDLLWGNYWLRRPDETGAHWRLFAINTFFEQDDSALARMALDTNGRLYWGTSAGPPRLVLLTPGADPTQMWSADSLPDPPPGLRALLAFKDGLIAAHAEGIRFYMRRGSGWTKRTIETRPAAALIGLGEVVWAVFDDGPRIVYRLK